MDKQFEKGTPRVQHTRMLIKKMLTESPEEPMYILLAGKIRHYRGAYRKTLEAAGGEFKVTASDIAATNTYYLDFIRRHMNSNLEAINYLTNVDLFVSFEKEESFCVIALFLNDEKEIEDWDFYGEDLLRDMAFSIITSKYEYLIYK